MLGEHMAILAQTSLRVMFSVGEILNGPRILKNECRVSTTPGEDPNKKQRQLWSILFDPNAIVIIHSLIHRHYLVDAKFSKPFSQRELAIQIIGSPGKKPRKPDRKASWSTTKYNEESSAYQERLKEYEERLKCLRARQSKNERIFKALGPNAYGLIEMKEIPNGMSLRYEITASPLLVSSYRTFVAPLLAPLFGFERYDKFDNKELAAIARKAIEVIVSVTTIRNEPRILANEEHSCRGTDDNFIQIQRLRKIFNHDCSIVILYLLVHLHFFIGVGSAKPYSKVQLARKLVGLTHGSQTEETKALDQDKSIRNMNVKLDSILAALGPGGYGLVDTADSAGKYPCEIQATSLLIDLFSVRVTPRLVDLLPGVNRETLRVSL